MGKMSDTRKVRPEAIKHYKAVQSINCDPEMKDEPRRYERKPFV